MNNNPFEKIDKSISVDELVSKVRNFDERLTEDTLFLQSQIDALNEIINGGNLSNQSFYSTFNTIQALKFTLDSSSKNGKLNIGIRGNTDVNAKKITKDVVITSKSADNQDTSQLILNWNGGEGRSTNGIFDTIVGGGFKDLVNWNTTPRAIITFDDGWSSVYSLAYQYMKTKGIKGTAYIVPTFIDTNLYMTKAQLDELHDAGWCLANHTTTHPNMIAYTYEQARSEIEQCNTWLNSNGYSEGVRHIAFPNGTSNAEVKQACRDLGLTTARDTGNKLNSDFSLKDTLHSLAPITCGLGGGSPNFTAVKAQIDNAIAQNKVCVMMFHRIVNVAGESGSSTTDGMNFVYSDFVQVIDYLVSKGVITETIDEFYNKLSGEINSYKAEQHRIEFDTNFQHIQRTGKVILDGSHNWTAPTVFQTNVYRAYINGFSTTYPDISTAVGSNHTCFNDLQKFQTVDAINGTLANRYQVAMHTSGALYISYDKAYGDANGLTTVLALKAWLNTHPITMIHQKITPVTHTIPVTITTNGMPDTSLRSFGNGTVITVSSSEESATPIIVESHPI